VHRSCREQQNRCRREAELGQGGMGTVYRTHAALLDRPVALKVLIKTMTVGRTYTVHRKKSVKSLRAALMK
jgi:serine/threonine protein kinase